MTLTEFKAVEPVERSNTLDESSIVLLTALKWIAVKPDKVDVSSIPPTLLTLTEFKAVEPVERCTPPLRPTKWIAVNPSKSEKSWIPP